MRTRPDAVAKHDRRPARSTRRSPSPSPEGATVSRGRALLEAHFDLIQRKLRHLSRCSGLPDSEAEELRSWALLKLVDNDYRILGRWEGRSSFSTFLTVVLVNLMRDYRIHVWGKWRPSAPARRRGEAAVMLERLRARDGLSDSEAIERLRVERGVTTDQAERLAAELPRRPERRRVSEELLLQVPVDGQVEIRIQEKEWERAAGRLRELLVPLLRTLPAEERVLLKLCFVDDLSIAAIAPILGRPQRELYSLRVRCLKRIRRSLEKAGLGRDQLGELLGRFQGNLGLEEELGVSCWENVSPRPSHRAMLKDAKSASNSLNIRRDDHG